MNRILSVIIPTFNREPDVVKAAASAAGQKLPRGLSLEVLVVDDGSSDDTGGVIRALARRLKSRVRLRYFWKPQAGPAAARNFGAARAKGQVLVFFDSDALANPGWLAEGWKALRRHPSWAGLEGRITPLAGRYTPFRQKLENPLGGRWMTCNLFVRTEVFRKLRGFDERFREPVREDTEFALRALAHNYRLPFLARAEVSHPLTVFKVSRFFRWARDGRYEPWLKRTYGELYLRHTKWIDGRAYPAYAWGHLLALGALPLGWKAALGLLGLGWLMTVYAWCRKRQVRLPDLLKLVLPALLAPYFRLAWVARGWWRLPKFPDQKA